jgi:hypothetical protein
VCLAFYQFLPKEEHFTYDSTFKRKVILYAEKIGYCAAGRKYRVSEACVCHWWSVKVKLFSCLTVKKSFSGLRKGRNPEIDAYVVEYFKDLWNKRLPVTRKTVMSKAKECARNGNIPFKTNHLWCEKFMKRESLSLWWRTKISQNLPSEFETKLSVFQRFVIRPCQRNIP